VSVIMLAASVMLVILSLVVQRLRSGETLRGAMKRTK
jgi:hypothetical protein